MLSEDLESLWRQLANIYTDNPAGFNLTPDDCQQLLSRLWEMYHACLYLEAKIPPPTPTPEGENVLDFSKFRETKNKRRV